MEINVNGSGNNSSVKVFIIRILIAVVVGFCALAGSLGGYILKTFLPMYIEEMDIKKRELQPITATVLSVDREIKKDSVIGYMKLSYEYNGKDYVYDMKYYEEGNFHHSTAEEDDERPSREDNDMSSKAHWEELQAMVGKTQDLFIDPTEPDKLFFPGSEDTIKFLRIMVYIGIGLYAFIALNIVIALLIGRKFLKKSVRKVKERIAEYSEK
jgi:hypothetical protein